MRANVIVRSESNSIVHLVDTNIDEQSVLDVVARLRRDYGAGYKIDLAQIELARLAAATQ